MLNIHERAFTFEEAQALVRRMDSIGATHEMIIDALIARGLSRYAAENIVLDVLNTEETLSYVDRYSVAVGLAIVTGFMIFMSILLYLVSLQ
ncbi:MAG: hypothetical protein AAFN11_10570 [Chloroflexota bacterium]